VLVSLKGKKPQITKRVFASGAVTLDLAKRLARVSHEKKPRISKRVSGLPVIGLLTLVYFAAGKLGLMLASLHASASPVWPPAGIALAALLLLGYRAWPAIFVGAFLVNVTTAGNVATSLGVGSGNTLEALCGAWLVNRFVGGTTAFDRPQRVFKFALAAMVATIISPAFGVTSLALAGFADWTNYGAIWLTWWLGDITGDLLIAPLIILWSIASKRRWNRREAVEVGVLLLLLFVLGEAVFGGWLTISAKDYPIAFICGAIVIWTAFRFTQRETATGIFILSAIAIWGTLRGFGPFVGETENQSLLALQFWTAVLTITAMALSAGMAERRRADEAVRESEARINLAANAANLGLWVWNVRDDELWVTEKWRKLFGFAKSEPVNFSQLVQRVHPEDRERMKRRVQHMLEHVGVDRESEYRIILPDGSTRWIAGYGGVGLDEHGKPTRARGVSRDITERKIAEEELRETQQRMELAASAAELGMWMWDIVHDEIWITDKGRALFGFTPSEKLDFDRFRNRLHPEDRESVLKAVESSLRTGAEYRSEYRAVLPNGQIRWIAGRGHVEFNGDGQPVRMRGAALDITRRKQAELEAACHRNAMAHLSRVTMLGELSGSLAHELNQPLAAILSNAQAAQQFLKEDVFDVNELRQILAEIVAEDKRAGEVIRHVRLLFRKGELGQPVGNLDINDVVQDVLKLMRNDLANQGVIVQTDLAENLPVVQGDRVQLQQVLLNLMLNGCEAMIDCDSSERQLLITSGMENGAVHVSVTDRGGRIPEETMERVFEPFFTTKADGMGLGLSVCHTIIEAHQGKICVRNNAEGGATFHFSLPALSQAQKNST
jgi:PAS domain S-box-containing protein